MTLQLYAQPYDICAVGFYFESYEDFAENASKLRNSYGNPIEEFELQVIYGEDIDCDLANAIGVNQANLKRFYHTAHEWDEHCKTTVILAFGECGCAFDDNTQPDDFDLDIYPVDSLRDWADQFVDKGLFGDILKRLSYYIDYDAMARDLSVDYSAANVAGKRLVYRCT